MIALVPFSMLLAAKHSRAIATLVWFEVIPYLLLTVVFTAQFGSVGTAICWSTRAIADALLLLYLAKRLLGLSLALNRLPMLFVGYLFLLIPVLIKIGVESMHNLVWLVAFVFLTGYFLIIWKYVLDEPEKNSIVFRLCQIINRN